MCLGPRSRAQCKPREVATDRSPVRFDDLNVTVFPSSLMTRGDLSIDGHGWIARMKTVTVSP